MFSEFKTNKYFLNQYWHKMLFIIIISNAFLLIHKIPDTANFALFVPVFILLAIPDFYFAILAFCYASLVCFSQPNYDATYLLCIPLTVILSFTAGALLHNASHSSIGPIWFSRLIGEIVALWQLVGFPEFKIVHMLHHRYPDDPSLDPHPPLQKSYWQYLIGMRRTIGIVFINYYFSQWGKNEESIKNIKRLGLLSRFGSFFKVVFWYQILGQQLFTFFFVFSIVTKMSQYAWFNYATHITIKDVTTIANLDHGVYRFLNLITFGLYYHKNHHEQPNLFDPRKLNKKNTSAIKLERSLGKT